MQPSALASVAANLKAQSTIPAQVADGIRNLILNGQLRPGDRVVEWRIARELGIGQPTAREALTALENEGLLQRNPNKGCTVTSLSVDDIVHIYRVRVELEPLAAELAVENAANWNPKELKAALAELHKAAKSSNIEHWRRADLEFHQTLWRLSGNPYLEKSLSAIAIPFFAFAGLVFHQSHPKDLRRQAAEHDLIVQAILSGDSRKAKQVTAQVLKAFSKLWHSLL